jgi:dTDP-4-amino-4,6-dideoxygalactose transaminase
MSCLPLMPKPRSCEEELRETQRVVELDPLSARYNACHVLLATIEVGDEVIVTDPTYAGLINRIRLAGGVPRFVPFTFRPGDTWALDRGELAAVVGPKTKAMLLMSPSMPTGAMLDGGDWAVVADLCVRHDPLLIIDSEPIGRLRGLGNRIRAALG